MIKQARHFLRSGALKIQEMFPLFPNSFALVTGAPRSGTSAMASWIGEQPWVKSFSETKRLFVAHRLREALWKWERFSKKEADQRVRELLLNGYSQEGVYIGARLLLDKEPLDPLSLSPNEYGSFLSSVESIFPSVRFIVMVRSPEAVVSSIVNREWGFSLRPEKVKSRTVKEGITSWTEANQLATKIAEKKNSYLCQFEKLMERPEEVSRELARFLGLRKYNTFQPRETSEVTLSLDERSRVWNETSECRQQLADIGISYTPEKGS